MQFVPVVFVAIAFLLRALRLFDSADLLMVCAICVPSLGWLRLIFILRLKTSDRTRTTWATVRQIGTRLAGLNPNSYSIIYDAKSGKLVAKGRLYQPPSEVTKLRQPAPARYRPRERDARGQAQEPHFDAWGICARKCLTHLRHRRSRTVNMRVDRSSGRGRCRVSRYCG